MGSRLFENMKIKKIGVKEPNVEQGFKCESMLFLL